MAIKHDNPDQQGASGKEGPSKGNDRRPHEASGGTAGSTPAPGESKSGILADEPES